MHFQTALLMTVRTEEAKMRLLQCKITKNYKTREKNKNEEPQSKYWIDDVQSNPLKWLDGY